MGIPGDKRKGNLFMAISPTKASPESINTLTEPEECPGVYTILPEIPYSFRCVNANYVNAYAFPGGSIAVTRGILLSLNRYVF